MQYPIILLPLAGDEAMFWDTREDKTTILFAYTLDYEGDPVNYLHASNIDLLVSPLGNPLPKYSYFQNLTERALFTQWGIVAVLSGEGESLVKFFPLCQREPIVLGPGWNLELYGDVVVYTLGDNLVLYNLRERRPIPLTGMKFIACLMNDWVIGVRDEATAIVNMETTKEWKIDPYVDHLQLGFALYSGADGSSTSLVTFNGDHSLVIQELDTGIVKVVHTDDKKPRILGIRQEECQAEEIVLRRERVGIHSSERLPRADQFVINLETLEESPKDGVARKVGNLLTLTSDLSLWVGNELVSIGSKRLVSKDSDGRSIHLKGGDVTNKPLCVRFPVEEEKRVRGVLGELFGGLLTRDLIGMTNRYIGW